MRKYQPSNGSESLDFQEQFCFRCQFYHEEFGCPILNATLFNNRTDTDYPSQWVEEEDLSNPRCTGFQELARKPMGTLPLTDAQKEWLNQQMGRVAK